MCVCFFFLHSFEAVQRGVRNGRIGERQRLKHGYRDREKESERDLEKNVCNTNEPKKKKRDKKTRHDKEEEKPYLIGARLSVESTC